MENYAGLYTNYAYSIPGKIKINLGDCVQSLAIKNLLNKFGITRSSMVNRDYLNIENQQAKVIMQGWFAYGGLQNTITKEELKPFPISESLNPIFIGFHLSKEGGSRKIFKNDKIKFKGHIGCRDVSTRNFLRKCGIDAYLSLCNTLTFDKIENRTPCYRVFVDEIPENLGLVRSPNDMIISNEFIFNGESIGPNEWILLEKIIESRYNHIAQYATKVYTSRIHVYMPMLAMEVPVIYTGPTDERTDILKIVNSSNISYIKNLMIKNFEYQVFGNGVDISPILDKLGDNI